MDAADCDSATLMVFVNRPFLNITLRIDAMPDGVSPVEVTSGTTTQGTDNAATFHTASRYNFPVVLSLMRVSVRLNSPSGVNEQADVTGWIWCEP